MLLYFIVRIAYGSSCITLATVPCLVYKMHHNLFADIVCGFLCLRK